MPTLKTITLGCKVNQYETEYVRQGLARLGYRQAVDGEPADLCIVNTCTVTAHGDAKSRKAIRLFARENPGAKIIVMGCYATRAAEQLAAMPGVSEVVTDKRELPGLLARLGVGDVPSGISTYSSRHRAYVKVQDGCRMPCSYCIIPYTRPYLSSRPVGEILDEVRRLVDNGHREIVLTGIHLGHYGKTTDGAAIRSGPLNLAGLVRRLVELPGAFRVRISSIEAVEATPELLAVMADRPDRVCPHLHLSMQSGSDAVLVRMRRRQTSAEFLACCDRVRDALEGPALTTDVIVGFPGETEADFQASCRAVEAAGFSKLHVFRFSARQETPAADFPDQVAESVKRRRAAELSALGQRLRENFCRSLIGRPLQVLVETLVETEAGRVVGTCARYVPVELSGTDCDVGRLATVVAEEVRDGRLLGGHDTATPSREC